MTRRRILRIGLLALLPLYVLSSGPVIATAFWLREATNCDAYYGVTWVYYPLFLLSRSLSDPYIGWWVNLFGTRGPG